jgi:hypothetical protein
VDKFKPKEVADLVIFFPGSPGPFAIASRVGPILKPEDLKGRTIRSLGGHVDYACGPTQTVSPHIKSGTLRGLAVTGEERLQEFPDIPSSSELGYPVFYFGWYGLVGPKGIPQDISKNWGILSGRWLRVRLSRRSWSIGIFPTIIRTVCYWKRKFLLTMSGIEISLERLG